MNNILVVAAHPDDEILGAGGTMHKWNLEDNIHTLIFSAGRHDPLDQKFETKPITYWITKVEEAIKKHDPDIVYTHIFKDVNKDHQVVHEAVTIACRPTKSNVKAVYGFDSTQSPFNTFNPTYFEVLTIKDIEWKVKKMVELYEKEMNMPYRTSDGIYTQAKYWGHQLGVEFAEAFEVILQMR